MLDHIFTDAIGAVREPLERALLERHPFAEQFQSDLVSGDVTWQCAYWLPGEADPPRVQADLTLVWSTWSQTAYRTWMFGETTEEPPRIEIEVVLRVQRLRERPDPQPVIDLLGTDLNLENIMLRRLGVRIETGLGPLLDDEQHALEIGHEATVELDQETLTDPERLDGLLGDLAGWISSTLVRLDDHLGLEFLPAEGEGHTP